MKTEQCPICSTELELQDVTPCWDCGHASEEIEHFHSEVHTFAEFEVFGSNIVLCDICAVDFASYDPSCFGLTAGTRIGLGTFDFRQLKTIENYQISKDKVCPVCNHRLRFLNWMLGVRENLGTTKG